MSSIKRRGKGYLYRSYTPWGEYRETFHTTDRSEAMSLKLKKDQEIAVQKNPTTKISCVLALKNYLVQVKNRRTHQYYISNKNRIQKFLDTSKVISLDRISAKMIQDFIDARLSSGLSKYDVNYTLSVLKAWLNWCVVSKYLFVSPADNVKKYQLPEKAKRSLSEDEVATIILKAKKETLYSAVLCAIYTGMRKEELFHLSWKDINWKENVINVVNTELHTTKSKKIRKIPLHPALKDVLKAESKLDGLCFPRTNRRRIIGRIFRLSKIADGGWHLFRHTFATTLLRNGADAETVRDLCGHSSLAVTLGYLHTTPQHQNNAVQSLNFTRNASMTPQMTPKKKAASKR